VEEHFWKVMFPGYDQWRRDWFDAYQKKGYFDTLAGFHHEGVFRRNEVINTPGQGTASACKMRGLINLTNILEERGFGAYPNCEIHDSILGIVPKTEVEDYLVLARWAMVDELREAWPFICTPIAVEGEVTPPGGTWYEKAPCEIPA
jgi:DNA polymerase I-like protein with 3'-5' exonuclease and polymerase domains